MTTYKSVVGYTKQDNGEKPYLYCLKLDNESMVAYRIYDAFVRGNDGKFYYQKSKVVIKDDLDKELIDNFHREYKAYHDFGTLPNGNAIIYFEDIPKDYRFRSDFVKLTEIPHIE